MKRKMALSEVTGFSDKMFGPLTFEDSKCDIHACSMETKCLLCEDSFNLGLRLDIFLRHIFDVHNCVIEDVQNIRNLNEYILYWRERLKNTSLEQIIPSVKEDKEIRHKLQLEYVLKVQEIERVDKSFTRQCLFCRLVFEGTRQGYLDHLSSQHNLQLGSPQNLVFIEELINHIDKKLCSLVCIYCEGVFPERNILKEHMRKKLHKRINPQNSEYDKYYIVNYLEVGKSWRVIEKEHDRYAISTGSTENSDEEYSDWKEKEDQITCLLCAHTETNINNLCLHMDSEHDFDFVISTQKLDFYQKVKFVNFLRKQRLNLRCCYCEKTCDSVTLLEGHMREEQHCRVPEVGVFDQPEFYFPTYENDAFLYFIDDVED